MNKILLLLLCVLFLLPAAAQTGRKDIVYLKSGGVIKGQVITRDAELVKINSAGNEWVFKSNEVDSISEYKKKRDDESYRQGIFLDTSMGVLIGNANNAQQAPFSFMSSFNVRMFGNVYLGAGAGAEFLQETYMPAFGQLQIRFRDSKFTPFINLQAGYQLPMEDAKSYQPVYYSSSNYIWPGPQYNTELDAEGGYMLNPSLGFQRFSSDNFGWFFAFGYRYHELHYSGKNGYKLETNLSRLSLKIGFIFN
ncbi:MAG TPA: hypothetical protein VFG54_18260 [Prolixibacteraceae bacterium]|nr:hypothetical protein [Prolixibacteraceae bacterium]